MNTPECVEALPREMIRRAIANAPVVGFQELLGRAKSFLALASVLPSPTARTYQFSKSCPILPSILAYGRSGTGKTTFGYCLYLSLSEILSEDVGYYHVRLGSLLNPNLGQTSRNIEELFEFLAQSHEPPEVPFVHFDEVDAISLSRARSTEHDAIRRALSSFLCCLDRMVLLPSRRWILYATTNIAELVDPALHRRFHLKLDFEEKRWTRKEYYELLRGLLIPENAEATGPEFLNRTATICYRKRLTPSDVRQLVLEAVVASHGNGSFENTLQTHARTMKRTESVRLTKS